MPAAAAVAKGAHVISPFRRPWCRLFHRDQALKASLAGHGTLRCSLCGAGFTDLHDAGRLHVGELDQYLSPQRLGQLQREAAVPGPQIEGGLYRVLKGGKVLRTGRI